MNGACTNLVNLCLKCPRYRGMTNDETEYWVEMGLIIEEQIKAAMREEKFYPELAVFAFFIANKIEGYHSSLTG